MSDELQWADDLVFPALLRAARKTYASAIRAALVENGFDDMPRNGSYIVGGIARNGQAMTEDTATVGGSALRSLASELSVSKQAVSQLVDTLVLREYLDRAADPDDRRRMTIALTPRGAAAASVISDAVAAVDAAVLERMGAGAVQVARRVLGAVHEAGQG